MNEASPGPSGRPEGPLPPEVRWTVGCLVASLATVGALILVALVAIALSPPTWVQVLLGAGLACGGAIFAWMIASALGQRRGTAEKAELRSLSEKERAG